MAWCKVGDKVENIFAAEDVWGDMYRYGVVRDVYLDRDGEEMVEVEYPGYFYAEIRDEYLRADTRGEEK
jgi:hypothetical protein